MKKIISAITAAMLTIGALAIATPSQALEPGVTVITQVRELAGTPYLAVRVLNDSETSLRARVEAPVVTDVKTVEAGKNAYWSIRLGRGVPLSGEGEVTIQQFVDGTLEKETVTFEYDAN